MNCDKCNKELKDDDWTMPMIREHKNKDIEYFSLCENCWNEWLYNYRKEFKTN